MLSFDQHNIRYTTSTVIGEEARDKLLRWETFGTAWDPPIPATMKPLILITVVLIAIQAVANLIADWSKEKEVHDLAEEVAHEYVD